MNYSYVLLSERDGKFYIGSTSDLRVRLQEHDKGGVRSTAYRRPLQLIYYEACLSIRDAGRRERYLKSGRGGRYLKQRLACWLSESRSKLERC
jgi:putative endonuclease